MARLQADPRFLAWHRRRVLRQQMHRARRYAMAVNVGCLTTLGVAIAFWVGGMSKPVTETAFAFWVITLVMAISLDRYLDDTEQRVGDVTE